jgi:uncharacterized Zn ribbon protein
MKIECSKCENFYDDADYSMCPRCKQEYEYELGLQTSRENKKKRSN